MTLKAEEGSRDVFIFSVDGLRGLEEVIRASYPDSDIQRVELLQESGEHLHIMRPFFRTARGLGIQV